MDGNDPPALFEAIPGGSGMREKCKKFPQNDFSAYCRFGYDTSDCCRVKTHETHWGQGTGRGTPGAADYGTPDLWSTVSGRLVPGHAVAGVVFQPQGFQAHSPEQGDRPELLLVRSCSRRRVSRWNRIYGNAPEPESRVHADDHASDQSVLAGGLPGMVAGRGAGNLPYSRTERSTHDYRRAYPAIHLVRAAGAGSRRPLVGGDVAFSELVANVTSSSFLRQSFLGALSSGLSERTECPYTHTYPNHRSNHHRPARPYPRCKAAACPDH